MFMELIAVCLYKLNEENGSHKKKFIYSNNNSVSEAITESEVSKKIAQKL